MQKKYLFIIIPIALLIVIIIVISVLNTKINNPSPRQATRPSPFPTLTQRQQEEAQQTKGESGMTSGEAKEFIERRNRADNAYLERKNRLPFITSLPYQTNHFKVEIMATSDTVTVTTYGTDQTSNLQFREEAKNWLAANGADFQLFTLQFVPQNP